MSNRPELSEAKRALLEKYLRGERPQTPTHVESIHRRAAGNAVPLSSGQQQLWLLSQLIPDTPVYTECVTIHLPGPLDIAALEKSFNEILRRHEAWRTSFPLLDGQPIQVIHPPPTLTLPTVDLRHLPETEALRMMTKDAQQPFDLANGPLLRPTLIRLGDNDHRLFLTLHHIIFDGFSLYQIFLPELRAVYEAFLVGQPTPLAEVPIQYADFAVWQREWLQGNVIAEQLAYWKKQLAGAPATLALPTDRPRPLIQTYRGLMYPFALSKSLTNALKTLSSKEGVTLYMTVVAAFQTLLYRHTGQEDILLGTAISDRKRPEVQGLMGFFLNTLVLRTDLSGNPTFREVLQRVREVVLEAHAHQDVPFEQLVKELQPERDLSQNPLFQAMLSLEPPLSLHPSGWTLTQMDVETDTTKFDLAIELDDRPEGLIGRFEYSTDLFDAQTIGRLAGHWQTLLESIVANPEQHIAELPMLTTAERQQILEEWNTTRTAYPQERRIHQLFEDQVERVPDTLAVICDRQQITYQELNLRANQLAHRLQQLGVGPEVLVGLCLPRSLEMVVGLLGILKSGGAYVPLDPTYPSERLAFMLQDAQVSVLLTQTSLLELLSGQSATGRGQAIAPTMDVLVEAHNRRHSRGDGLSSPCWPTQNLSTVACVHTENPVSEVQGSHLAYLIYTSGSTGHPKGVAVTHHNLWHSTQARLSYYHEPVSSFLLLSSIAFDSSVAGIFWTLCQGGTLLLPAEEALRDPFQLSAFIEQQHASHLLCVPSLYTSLLEHAGAQQLETLRTVIVAGERCPKELVERHWQRLPHCALFNEYGPTEASVWSTVYRCEATEKRLSIPIGRPIANTQVYILDAHLQPVPIGVTGELYIGGDGVARGYLHRPELTAERFIPNPFSKEPQARLYKTGDLVRYLPDGNIEFLDRSDHQVKIRGFRIELGEIEEVIRQHPQVRETIVVAREDSIAGKRLVAYIVLHKEQTVTIGDLHDHVMTYVPAYMIPSAFVLLETLPLMPNGKVDRQALPVPDQVRPQLQEVFVPPRTPLEEVVAGIWFQVLGVEQLGMHDDFFKLGGHSLLATQVIAHIRVALQVELPLRRFFEGPTIAELAEAIKERKAGEGKPSPLLRPVSRKAHRMILSAISSTRDSGGSRSEKEKLIP